MFTYICPCCLHSIETNSPLLIICDECYWEHDLIEEANDPNCLGKNGMILDEYRSTWIRLGKPKKPRWQWPEEIN